MGILGGITKSMSGTAEKALKADNVKSIKLKLKVKKSAVKQDGSRGPAAISSGT